jgi:GNAT superfamily N-acetyltransferase
MGKVGAVETAAAPFWRMLPPDVRVATVRRPVAEVVESLTKTGIRFDLRVLHRNMRRLDAKLDQIERRVPNALSVRYADLGFESVCAKLFEFCLQSPHDSARWEKMAGQNLQCDLGSYIRYAKAHEAQLNASAQACGRRIRADLTKNRVKMGIPDVNGISIQEEPAEVFLRDGEALFAEHCEAVGEPSDEWTRKNIPLMLKMADAGAFIYMTARCNGRMLGYLQTVVAPSLEQMNRLSATECLFFVSRDAKNLGLGMKLQRATIERLRQKGVSELKLRAGTRGSGPDLGVVYRRLGAVEDGQMFKLELKAA